ncbi:chorismate synthase [Roseimicrobium gellanilyticum]|uniref:Chorismate synthase n=1 Tax=Roseimicrobium gellanilyticum TaxID=748857 RepID=A0A366HBM6_9BACT|nr:chorismate synthase [Roseimicrobium gellanilyticum]RBP39761.1 chorismate synthase [Roseimicrobium gellanilyticum]
MASSFGTLFRVSTFGESHGPAVGCIVDGCPPQVALTAEDIQVELDRRRPGQSKIVTQRKEGDRAEILSGVVDGQTVGTPIAIIVRNEDQRSDAYKEMETAYRPSHADYTYDAKYGVRAVAGGGRASARETIGRVAAGAIAQKVLATNLPGYQCLAYVHSVRDIMATVDPTTLSRELVESNIVRTADPMAAEKMIALIEEMRKEGNSVGGVVECVVRGVPAGLGEPVFDKLEADLAKAMLSLPATKGFEIGSGFEGARMTGLQHNDEFFTDEAGKIRTRTNRSGGIQGGISNGEEIVFRVAFKPTATVLREQNTVTRDGTATTLKARGRHDPCVLPRAVPMVEAMVHLVVCDHWLRQRAQNA